MIATKRFDINTPNSTVWMLEIQVWLGVLVRFRLKYGCSFRYLFQTRCRYKRMKYTSVVELNDQQFLRSVVNTVSNKMTYQYILKS